MLNSFLHRSPMDSICILFCIFELMKESYVYIMTNRNNTTFYIGVTNNLIRRVSEHNDGIGSVFTRKYNLEKLVYFEEFTDIREAIYREKQLKNWHRQWKINLIKTMNPEMRDLFFEILGTG